MEWNMENMEWNMENMEWNIWKTWNGIFTIDYIK